MSTNEIVLLGILILGAILINWNTITNDLSSKGNRKADHSNQPSNRTNSSSTVKRKENELA